MREYIVVNLLQWTGNKIHMYTWTLSSIFRSMKMSIHTCNDAGDQNPTNYERRATYRMINAKLWKEIYVKLASRTSTNKIGISWLSHKATIRIYATDKAIKILRFKDITCFFHFGKTCKLQRHKKTLKASILIVINNENFCTVCHYHLL